jgi:glycerol-3-phosphate acyltransferase PlsY
LRITAGITAILGHNFTCWLHFKGGKGIATSAGVLIALVPWALIIILSIFIILFLLTRYVSVGSIAASFSLPFATWFTTKDVGLTAVTGAMGALAIFKHRKNIQRLLNGTENRINFHKKEATS